MKQTELQTIHYSDIQMLFSCSIVSALNGWYECIWVNVVLCFFRHVGTDYLFCDCQLRWLLSWIRSQALRVGNESVCVYPTRLHGLELRSLQENQLTCGKTSLTLTNPKTMSKHYVLLSWGIKIMKEFSKNGLRPLMALYFHVLCKLF